MTAIFVLIYQIAHFEIICRYSVKSYFILFDLTYTFSGLLKGDFSMIIYIYTYKNIQKVLLLEFVQGEIVFSPYYNMIINVT